MKLQTITMGVLLLSALAANAAQQPINSADNVGVQRGKVNSNFTELYALVNGAPWLAQTTAPNIHNIFWIDTSGTSPAIKYWDGDSWEVAASGGDGTYTLPTASTETKGGVKIGARLTMTGDVLSADVQTTDISGKEDSLGNPSTNGYVLSSTTAGVRSWVEITGDQDLSGYALTSSVLSKTNTTAFAPTADYHPATKKYVDDSITTSGGYTDEQAQDAAGAMFSGNTETGITVTYDDATGKVNFVVPTTLASFTGDATHRLVTDTEKSTWNAKQNTLVAGTDYLTPTGSAASLTFTATGFDGNLATTINTVQELADAVDDLSGGSDDQTAAEVPITDSGGYYTATTVEGALAERGADPLIHWDTATITEVENSPVAGTNTISVKAGVFQAYDANLITWPSAISATEVGYLDGLGGALTTLLSAKAPLASPVFTTSAALPQGTAPTVDAAGEIAIDTTSDQLIYFGGAKRVLTYKKFEPFVVKSPVDADDFLIGPFPTAITLTNILLVGQGTGSIVITPQICGADTTTCSNLESITANGGVDTDDGSLAYSSVSAGGFVKILCSAPSGEVNFLSGSIYYVETGD